MKVIVGVLLLLGTLIVARKFKGVGPVLLAKGSGWKFWATVGALLTLWFLYRIAYR
jgi:hypothetical protein